MSMQLVSATTILRIFCATLMLSLGFAHKPVEAAAAAARAFDEAYRFPDGSFAEICEAHADVDASHKTRKSDHSGMPSLFCEACRLASSILLPTPDATSWVRAHFAWLDNRPTPYMSPSQSVDDHRPRARAPPVLL
ncbi:hypothetical protein [Rhizobium skierniewicense]|uniref:hypothetical protein n=1 Tax=Rhizobium skierniewicense TaxID=984260 RepID=UPI0015747865|nr:hypothetical protein [Rhizobium skierniewicense]NTF32161.1 hypothetical protein [Rhizobium skierniewicense]